MKTQPLSALAADYKRCVAGKFILVDGHKLEEKLGGSDFYVTVKLDGVMQLIRYADGVLEACGSRGASTPHSLPCMQELAEALKAQGVTSTLLAAELYANLRTNGRERVCDVATALADPSLHDTLRLAPFDLLELAGRDTSTLPRGQKMDLLESLCRGCRRVSPVQGYRCTSVADVRELFDTIVTEGGAEGLVVHPPHTFVYKLKPRHTIDVAVIGFTEGEGDHKGMVRDLLTATIDPDGTLRQVATVGGGFTEQQRRDLFGRLRSAGVESDYVETDSRSVAFTMVHPELVVEISAVDFVSENAAGEPKENMLLEFDYKAGYHAIGRAPGVKLHSATFVRERPDKSVCPEDARESQLTDLCEFSKGVTVDFSALPQSQWLTRRVFVKTTGALRSVRKFLIWKTNKEHTGRFPAYVLHYTDYSPSRAEALRRDLRISNSREQIFELLDQMLATEIKKGWQEIL